MTIADFAEHAAALRQSVAEYHTPGVYRGLHVTIDLTNAQGRWELVVLALLLAARVSEAVAEYAFVLLREGGLLSFGRVLAQTPVDMIRMREILEAEYRALIDRSCKISAIYSNARLLEQSYRGDLQNAYLQHTHQGAACDGKSASLNLLRSLRQLHQINNRAAWICRTMAEAGLWVNLPPEATAYYDRHVRCALYRLGLIDDTSVSGAVSNNSEVAVRELFGGDTIPLYRMGRFLCLPADPDLCTAKCAVTRFCRYWAESRTLNNTDPVNVRI